MPATSLIASALTGLLLFLPGLLRCEPLDDAIESMRIGDFAEAFCIMKPLAEQGNIEAQYNLGWMYHNGYGLRVNDHLALEWWRLASGQGHSDASFSIGMLYDLGEGQISRNPQKAVDYYLLAARDHHEEAILILRSMLIRDDRAVNGRKRRLIDRYGALLGTPMKITASRLNIRDKPSLEGRVITRLEKGHEVIELHRQGKWSRIGLPHSDNEEDAIAWAYNPLLRPARTDSEP